MSTGICISGQRTAEDVLARWSQRPVSASSQQSGVCKRRWIRIKWIYNRWL